MAMVLKNFNKAVSKLEEVLQLQKTEVVRDSAIKRFEICFDLAWKSIKLYAKSQGLECYSPKSCFKTAFQLKLINYQKIWLRMIDDRNTTAHIYKEKYANQVYKHLKQYLGLFKQLIKALN